MRALRQMLNREPLAAKVPEITILFWVVKLLTTFMGEVLSDFLGFNVAIGGPIEVIFLVVAIWWQFSTPRYYAPAYWFLAAAIATFGTGVADASHSAGIPYAGTVILWAAILAIIFWQWQRSEGTLSIHSITSNRREKFYWATVFATFALGTALGDFTASVVNLGYAPSGFLFAGIFLIPIVAWKLFKLNVVVAFWFAYIVTRPLGASFADYLSKPSNISGANFGNGPTSAVAAAAIVVLVIYLAIRRPDIQQPATEGLASEAVAPGAPELA